MSDEDEREVRPAVPSRPANPMDWGYLYYLDEALPAADADALKEFFERFSMLTDECSVCFYVVGPDTDPERWYAAWADDVEIVELETLRAQLPRGELPARLQRLREVLARPSRRAWSEFTMLITTWDAATLPRALAEAEPLLARWPDELRTENYQWKWRPALNQLARVVDIEWGMDGREGRTHLRTRDLDEVEPQQRSLAGITTLEASGSPDLPARVARLTGLQGLERLILRRSEDDGDDGEIDLAALLAAPHLQRLTALALDGYALSPSDLEALAGCTQPLAHLRLRRARLGPEAGHALARLAARTGLRSLDLKGNELGPDGAQALFAGPDDWRTLAALDLANNGIGDRGAAAIAGASLGALRRLDLTAHSGEALLTATGATALATSRSLGALHTLNVFGHAMGAEGVAAVLYSPNLRALRSFDAHAADVSLAAVASVRGDGEPVAVERIRLGGFDEVQVEYDLARATFLRSVKYLEVDSLDGLNYAGLLGCPLLERLEVLVLGAPANDEAAAWTALTTISPPPTLRYVDLSNWEPTAELAAALAASPLGRQVWGVKLMVCDTPREVWDELYRGGVPLVERMFEAYEPGEFDAPLTFREVF